MAYVSAGSATIHARISESGGSVMQGIVLKRLRLLSVWKRAIIRAVKNMVDMFTESWHIQFNIGVGRVTIG